ncbi:MAG: hypothetical protein Q7T56_11320 [Nocardioidaceae bacterium]|nr:hypothetical protein [Nocardioidaceae bacterium]
MTPRATLALKVFALMGLPFGVFMGLYLAISTDGRDSALTAGVVGGLASGLFFGLFMAVFVTVVDQMRRTRTGAPLAGGTRPSHRMRVAIPVHDVVLQARNVLWHLAGSHAQEDPAAGTLTVTTRPSWWSWGDVVTVTLQAEGQGSTLVQVASRPRLRTTLVDYGSNAGHVRTVVEGLTPPVRW